MVVLTFNIPQKIICTLHFSRLIY